MAEVKTTNPCAIPVRTVPPGIPCPTCIPDESYLEPTWYTTEEPYLNKKTCEYMISVTVNSRGDSHSPDTIKKAKLPFKKLLKTYIRPGIRLLLRHFDKLETDKIVCASYTENTRDPGVMDSECREVIDVDFNEFITERKKAANIQGSDSYTVPNIDKKIKKKWPQVKNLNALELYGNAVDYHFTGYGGSIMKVLVTIPAYIFDQVPDAPDLPEVNTSPKTLFISPRRLRTDLAKLREALLSFGQFQAFFYRFQNGSLFHKETGERFYIKFYAKRLENFEAALETLLNKNDYSYSGFMGIRTPNMPWKLKFVFDTSDEKAPFTLKRVGAKTEGCPYKKLGKGLKSFLRKVNKDQTLLGLIGNFDDVMDDLNARETIGWLDFCFKYIFPDLAVNYGSSDKIKEGMAVNCLADKLGLDGLDDFVHEAVGRFSELFQYAINKEACRALSSDSPVPIAVKEDGGLEEKYIKEWGKNKLSRIGEPSILEEMFRDIKASYNSVNGSDGKLRALLSAMSPCNMFELTLKAIQCLMSGMSFNLSMRVLAKKALSTMAGAALEKVIEGLPFDKQEAIRKKVEAEFGNMPAPWETGYKPGSLESVLDRKAAEDVAEKQEKVNSALKDNSSLAKKGEEMYKRVEELNFCLSNPDSCTIDGKRREATKAGESVPLAPLLTYSGSLSRGSKGQDVSSLQNALNALGQSLVADGDFGRKTKDAVKSYQSSSNLSVDGIAGPATKDNINQKLKEKGTTTVQDVGTLRGDLFAEQIQQETDLLAEVKKQQDFLKELQKDAEEAVREEMELKSQVDSAKKQIDEVKNKKSSLIREIANRPGGITSQTALEKATIKTYDDQIDQKRQLLRSSENKLETFMQSTGGAGAEYYEPLIRIQREMNIPNATAALTQFQDRDRDETAAAGVQEDSIDKRIKEIKESWIEELDQIHTEGAKINKKVSDNDKTLDDLLAYQIWDTSDPKAKSMMEMVERQKYDRAFVTGLSPDDEIEQGTFGKGLGNIQQAIAMAYVEAIMDTAEIQELITLVNKIPGVKFIGNFLAGLNCPVKSFIYPPISSFLSSLTFDPCGPGKTRLALPRLLDLPTFNGWNFIRLIVNAFLMALKRVVIEIMFAIIFKLLSIVFDLACKTLQAAGRGIGAALTGDAGWRNAVDDIFCGDEKPEEERDDHAAAVINAAAPSLSGEAAKDVAKTMSLIGTKKEYMRAISSSPDEQDLDFMNNLATFVAAKHPEHADLLGTPEKMTGLFAQVGNLLTAEQIGKLKDLLDDEDDSPLEESICLTDDQFEAWNKERTDALEQAGLDPEIAKDFVDRQNERRKSDLADVADILNKGPEGMLGEALDKALGTSPTDPECEVSNSAVQITKSDQFQEIMQKATEGMFKRLEAAFLDDVILWRWPIDPRAWVDGPGVLSTILADKENYTLNFHFIARNNIFFKMMKFITFGLYPKHEDFPETVGKVFRDTFESVDFTFSGNQISIPIIYQITDEYKWKSKGLIDDTFKVDAESGGKKYVKAFDYKFRQRSPENILSRFRVERVVTTDFKKWMKENKLAVADSDLKSHSYKTLVLKKFLEMKFKDFSGVKLTNSGAEKLIHSLNGIANKKLLSSILSQDGGTSPGFTHGSKNTKITADHLEYVGPKGGEYDFDEEDAVFGKAKSSHPRVKFLDPAEHGGSYTNPNIYISPPKDKGLMKISKVFLPEMKNGCEPKIGKTHFLFTHDLQEQVDKAMSKITPHKKLKHAPDCVKEYPFDKVASPATLASLEGTIIATIRVYLSHFLIKSMPVWSNLPFDPKFDKEGKPTSEMANYDELLPEYIVKLMERGLSNEASMWARATYERWPYWLLFLEQVAQVVQRRVKDGTIEENTEIAAAFQKINEMQEKHVVPTIKNMTKIAKKYDGDVSASQLEDDYLAKSIVRGGALIGGITNRGDLPKGGSFGTVAWGAFGLRQARFSAKIWTIYEARKAAMSLLKYLVIEQFQFYADKIRTKMQSLNYDPFYYDIAKVFVGSHGAALGKAPESGIWATSGISEGEVRDFGTVNDVSDNPMEKHSLGEIKMSDSEYDFILNKGGIYMEKYVRIFDKEEPGDIPGSIKDRDDSLRGVVSIKNFKEMILKASTIDGLDTKISEYFFREEDKQVGVSFGIRVCCIPPDGFKPFSGDPNPEDLKKIKMEKSFLNAPIKIKVETEEETSFGTTTTVSAKILKNSKYSFPIVSCEIPLNDVTLGDINDSDKDLDQDIKCYYDQMCATEEFQLIFDKIINLRRSASIAMVTTYDSWVPSIGALDSGERNEIEVPEAYEDEEDGPPQYSDAGDSPYFNDSRKECRKLFIANYKRNDFDPDDDEEDFDFVKDNLNRMLSDTYSAVLYDKDVPFWRKWKVTKENPMDNEGNACGNAFTKLFSK